MDQSTASLDREPLVKSVGGLVWGLRLIVRITINSVVPGVVVQLQSRGPSQLLMHDLNHLIDYMAFVCVISLCLARGCSLLVQLLVRG